MLLVVSGSASFHPGEPLRMGKAEPALLEPYRERNSPREHAARDFLESLLHSMRQAAALWGKWGEVRSILMGDCGGERDAEATVRNVEATVFPLDPFKKSVTPLRVAESASILWRAVSTEPPLTNCTLVAMVENVVAPERWSLPLASGI